ncbi:hypothetical protein HMPREF0621_1353 [Pasteurella dagmatis ATCC 43325]|uniref:Uncharacterized protein n=1 Tax=Pasteurella dagmatis ATCC 43325 TaxID=667128 RepID=C9PQS9_9PAST|nr:hypothetical protein HMPREF0621_1353 [Pasteurella dagmatis ATCC 43325]
MLLKSNSFSLIIETESAVKILKVLTALFLVFNYSVAPNPRKPTT